MQKLSLEYFEAFTEQQTKLFLFFPILQEEEEE